MAMDSGVGNNATHALSSTFRSEDPWIKHEEILRELYCVRRKTLKEVKEEMERSYGFPPSTP
jgi:hypothetical protein